MSPLSSWIIFLIVGRILIYLWQNFPLPTKLEDNRVIHKLHICDLCAGVWIYALLSFVMRLFLLDVLGFTYFPVVSEFVTGGVVSFIVHVFVIGWKEKFNSMWVV